MRRSVPLVLPALLLLALRAEPVGAEVPPPAPLGAIGVDEHLGEKLPMELQFRDHDDQPKSLGALFEAERPRVLVIAYYRCPMLCGLVLEGVAKTLKDLDLELGKDFDIATISFDPEDTWIEARKRQDLVRRPLGGIPREDWPFFTGEEKDVKELLEALGVRVQKDPRTGEYAHPAVIFVLGRDGRISRYLYGFDIKPFDLELALVEAGEGKVGSTLQKVLLRCYAYDPSTRRYGMVLTSIYRVGGLVLLAAVGSLVLFSARRSPTGSARSRSGGGS